jgi:integrase
VQIPGLTIRKGPRGHVYKFKMDLYRNGVYQRTVYATFGRVDSVGVVEAKATALKYAALIHKGIDPTEHEIGNIVSVGQLMHLYASDLAARGKSERFRRDVLRRSELYLRDWTERPFLEITKTDLRLKHQKITAHHGPRVANQTAVNFATAWKIAQQILDQEIPECPAKHIRKNAEGVSDYSWFELAKFWQDTARVSPMLRLCWTFGLLSGLRVGNLCTLLREWVSGDKLIIPRSTMKVRDPRRGPFVVPLSAAMRTVIARANAYNDIVFPQTPWLFTSVSRDGRRLGTLQNIRPYGKVLRHVHRTACTNAEIHPELAAVLHDHSIQGIADRYTQRTAINFAALLAAQEKVTQVLLCSDADFSNILGIEELVRYKLKPIFKYRTRQSDPSEGGSAEGSLN